MAMKSSAMPVRPWRSAALGWSCCLLGLLQPLASAVELKFGRLRMRAVNRDLGPDGVIQPMEFDQRLLICNAYPSDSQLIVTKNGYEVLADAEHKLTYGQCRYIASAVAAQDKLDFSLPDREVHGSFEVGKLPASDAVLLLVLEKKSSDSPVVSFKSFAFPTEREAGDEAQLAVIDAFRGNTSTAHLKMEDHINGKPKATVSKRVEQLSFDRVYAVEEGVYDASVLDRLTTDAAAQATAGLKHTVKLVKGQNYVMLRTGDDKAGKPQALFVYPEADFQSAAGVQRLSGLALLLAAAAATLVVC
eukprot:TRINITY_DN80089_c0_g1_i1.p1 TRINITY_DN80089_c0_g1~~TRINITY_DN80089_c0_g1_i1.p1  ORF type:complete len:303 (-),score=86.00 TRINITY_DN80089_c0_g1_i1:138-1046(-)